MLEKATELFINKLIFPIIEEIVLPKIKKIFELEGKISIEEKIVEDYFQIYLRQRYTRFLTIDTLVFPNLQTEFKVLYEPLTIVSQNHKEKIEILIDSYPNNFLPMYSKVIIEDTAGMGKSTISKKLFLSIIEEQAGIPILIELRQINQSNDFLKEIQNQLSPIGEQIPIDLIVKFLKDGEFVFLLDGFDEISKADKEFVITNMQWFVEKADNNKFLITSRQESSLTSFSTFKKFKVKPLDKQVAYQLIKRYDAYSYKPISEQLIDKLEMDGDESIDAFLTNPFLVSLLYKSFEYKKDIPQKKTQFYRQVYDALFDAHDLSKPGYFKRDKHSDLHSDDFEKVLRHISYLTSKENKVEYSIDYITNVIEAAKQYTPELQFKASNYLKDLLETVPLFKKEGNNIKWAHKSLQDYFTAKFIWIDARNNQENILRKIYEDPLNVRFYNVLELFHELDPKGFEITILLWFLEEFQEFIKSYIESHNFLPEDLVIERAEHLFGIRTAGFVFSFDSKFQHNNASSSESYEDLLDKQVDHVFDYVLMDLKVNALRVLDSKSKLYKIFSFAIPVPRLETMFQVLARKMPYVVKYAQPDFQIDFDALNLKDETLYMIDTNINNVVNSKDFFHIATKVLESGFVIDYKEALTKLNEIKKYSNPKLDDNLLSW